MSLTGALAPGTALVGARETRRERRERSAARDARRRTLRAAAFVAFVVCGLALTVALVSPRAADTMARPVEGLRAVVAGALPSAAAPPPADVVVPARVVASSSCLAPGAHDTVLVEIGGSVRQFPLDACGSPVGRWVTAVAPATGTVGTARVLGTGSTAPAAASSAAATAPTAAGPKQASPMAQRMSLLLTVVAAVGTGGLVVAVARDRRHRARRAARPVARRAPRRH